MVITQGNIYWADFGPIQGHKQAGLRPALVVQNNTLNRNLSTTLVIPLTSNLEYKAFITNVFLPTKKSGLKKDSVALLYQISVIDRVRLKEKCGQLDALEFGTLRTRLMRLMY